MGTLRPYEPDATDWLLLRELQADARLSFNELARRIHLSAPAVAERVRRMEQAGVITGYRAVVDPAAVGVVRNHAVVGEPAVPFDGYESGLSD